VRRGFGGEFPDEDPEDAADRLEDALVEFTRFDGLRRCDLVVVAGADWGPIELVLSGGVGATSFFFFLPNEKKPMIVVEGGGKRVGTVLRQIMERETLCEVERGCYICVCPKFSQTGD